MRRFQPRLIPLIATGIGVAIFLRLGWWQWTKALTVEAAATAFEARHGQNPMPIGAALIDPQTINGMPVIVRGQYEAAGQFFLDNRQENGRPGVHVITPLRIENSQTRVLINRGWVGWGESRQHLPNVATPSGVIEVHGTATQPPTKKFFLISQEAGNTDQLKNRIDLTQLRDASSAPLQGFVIEQDTNDADDGLIRHWSAPENKAQMHRGYALQWLLITLALVVFFIISSLRHRPDSSA